MTPTEVELKLLLPGADGATVQQQLQGLAALSRRPARTQWLWNRYFDTPGQALRQQRSALRLRCVSDVPWHGQATESPAGQWIQTFKTAGTSSGGLSQRGEWETPVAEGRLDPQALARTPWAEMDPEQRLWRHLAPAFDTRCRRTTWQVARRDGTRIEVALDVGEIVAGDRIEPLIELELELQQGQAASLFALARQIARRLAVLPCDASKAERGYALAQGSLHAPRRTRAVQLIAGTDPQTAAQRTMGEMFDQFTRNLAGLCHADHPELVHQARVAWRRWRSATRLFAPWLKTLPPREGLRPLLQALGQLRDLDVTLHDTLPLWLPAYVGNDAAREQQADTAQLALAQAADAHRAQVRQWLERPATGAALLELAAWLHDLEVDGTASASEDQREADVRWARRRLNKLQHRLERSLAVCESMPDDEVQWHQARLLAKRTRYSLEALQTLLPARKGRRWLREATRVQTRIGADRDLLQASALVHALGLAEGLAEFLRGVAAARKI
jgi:inorganic triphosphatase YgiF